MIKYRMVSGLNLKFVNLRLEVINTNETVNNNEWAMNLTDANFKHNLFPTMDSMYYKLFS
jgi:hypothetical protein